MRLTRGGYSRADGMLTRRRVRVIEVVGLAAAIASVFTLDRMTGLPHVQHLYYFPIIFAAVRLGAIAGAMTAGLAIVLYDLANPHALTWWYGESDLLQIVVFVAVGLVAAKLANDARRLRGLAMTDDLTGLHNLRSFELELRRMVHSARDTQWPLSLLVIDVDRLKSLNDEHGHLAGAEAVRTVGIIIGERIPAEAVACRYGGDEFAIAIPRCPASIAGGIADDLRRAVRASVPVLAGVQFPEGALSISIGVASRSFDRRWHSSDAVTNDEESERLFRAADRALYAAKNGGRDRVSTAPPPSAAALRQRSTLIH